MLYRPPKRVNDTHTDRRLNFSSGNRSEVGRRITGLPFDIATDARLLNWRRRPSLQHRIGRCTQIVACDRDAVTRTTAVELPPIDEQMTRVGQEECLWGGCLRKLGDILTVVAKIREGVAGYSCFLSHTFRSILR